MPALKYKDPTSGNWVALSIGAPGAVGPKGNTGATGPQGIQGIPGASGSLVSDPVLCSLVDTTFRDTVSGYSKYTTWTVEHDPNGMYQGGGHIQVPAGTVKVRVGAFVVWDAASMRRIHQIELGTGTAGVGTVVCRYEGPATGYSSASITRVLPATPGQNFFLSVYSGSAATNILRGAPTLPISFTVEALFA